MITITSKPYRLHFTRPFGIAAGTRHGTEVVYVEVRYRGQTGFGEASLPPYLGSNTEMVLDYLSSIDLQLVDDFDANVLIDQIASGGPNYPAMAALDMALHDLQGKLTGQPCARLFGLETLNDTSTLYTVSMAGEADLDAILREAAPFPMLKIKAGGPRDKQWINHVSSKSAKPFCVDANQGWKKKEYALEMMHFVHEKGAVFVEQPLEKGRHEDDEWLKERSPLPLIADESFKVLDDLERVRRGFDGINVKLMKCGGMRTAYRIMKSARSSGLKVLLGCMSESSCGVAAAAQLISLADWADLDGPLLIDNDPFEGVRYLDGKIILSNRPGNGITKKAM